MQQMTFEDKLKPEGRGFLQFHTRTDWESIPDAALKKVRSYLNRQLRMVFYN